MCSVLPEEGDVLMVGCFSGLTVSHTASLIAEKHKANSNNQPTVYVCVSDRTVAQREDLQRAVSDMGCKSRHRLRPHKYVLVLKHIIVAMILPGFSDPRSLPHWVLSITTRIRVVNAKRG